MLFATVPRFSLTELPWRFRQWRYETEDCYFCLLAAKTYDISEYGTDSTTTALLLLAYTPSTDLQRQRGVCVSAINPRYSGNVGWVTYTTDPQDRNTMAHSVVHTDL